MQNYYLSKRFIIPTGSIAIFYFIMVGYLMNFSLFKDTILGGYPFSYKVTILYLLVKAMWSIMSGFSLVLIAITALLTGINLTLLIHKVSVLRSLDKLHFIVSSGSFFGLASSGCAACGLPILSLVGLGGSIVYLPFQGLELSIVAILLLLMSIYLLIKSENKEKVCAVPTTKTALPITI